MKEMMMHKTQRSMNKLIVNISAMLVLGMLANLANADERESLEQLKATTTNLIELLVKEGILPKDKAEAMMKKATEDAARQIKQAKALDDIYDPSADKKTSSGNAPDNKSVRVQYVPEHIKNEMRADIEKEVMAKLNYKEGERLGLPEWIDRIGLNGDLRLRYEHDSFGSNNASIATLNNSDRNANISNSTEDQDRFRLRARLGADVQVNQWLKGGLRLTTGLLTDPVSPNQTEGVSQGKFALNLDRAYLAASPLPWISVQGGRFANPFFHTDLVWDPDLAFDGVAATFKPKINDSWSNETVVGAFPIQNVQSSEVNKASSKWLYALQTGIKWQGLNKTTARLGLAYYDYEHVEGEASPIGTTDYDASIPAFRQKGNNTFIVNAANTPAAGKELYGLASKFKLIDITGQVDLMTFDPTHVTLTGDYVKNIGFDHNEILRRTGSDFVDETTGYQVRLDVGQNSFNGGASTEVKPNDWQVSLAYKRLEADSVLDAFTDSDFHLGGTDAEGWFIGANYAVDKNAWLSARYYTADSITGPTLAIDVLMLDFIAKF
jgi:hypothetical protein